MRSDRRTFLASVGLAGLAGVAGCVSGPGDDGSSPSQTPSNRTSVTTVDEDEYDLSVSHDVEDWDAYDPDWQHPVEPPALDVETETVVEGLKIPWDLSFAPNGDLFISERPGRLLRYDAGTVESVASPEDIVDATAIDVDDEGGWWAAGGEGGLMGTAVHPNYPDVPVVYAFYTYTEEGSDDKQNKLVYYDLGTDDREATTLIDGIPGETYHNGSRITFGPANYLWVTTGDAGLPGDAQDPSSLVGKVLRLNPDGSAPADNPDLGGDPRVYTLGHRNPQGITFMPDATAVENEHGPSARDEVNVLTPGENYGWDDEDGRARGSETYPGTDYARPVVNTGPAETWAPPGSVFYTGDAVPSWRNRLVVGGLTSQRLNVVTVYPTDGEPASAENGGQRFDADWTDDEYSAVHHTALENELGRIRHVEQGPDGALYAVTSNRDGRAEGFPVEGDDRLVRIRPAE
jgi:glucose/arabinose dehydrogenase